VTIGRGARVLVQGGVIGDIPSGGTYWGTPARPHREVLRAQAALYRLDPRPAAPDAPPEPRDGDAR
jgi:UDP-3-O-[3-hydroxymyristoyl] glucosamine N-acyltransferase